MPVLPVPLVAHAADERRARPAEAHAPVGAGARMRSQAATVHLPRGRDVEPRRSSAACARWSSAARSRDGDGCRYRSPRAARRWLRILCRLRSRILMPGRNTRRSRHFCTCEVIKLQKRCILRVAMLRSRLLLPHETGRDSATRQDMASEEASMALDTTHGIARYDAPEKDLYEVGEMPPMGYRAASRCMPGRSGASGMASRTSPSSRKSSTCPRLDSHEVLVLVMAAGVNYNGVWAGLGVPITPFDVHKAEYHIAGSDASGIVWAVGDKVQPLEGRRRGRDPLQPGRRRRRGVQRRRPDVLAHASGSGATRRRTAPSRSSPACRRSS